MSIARGVLLRRSVVRVCGGLALLLTIGAGTALADSAPPASCATAAGGQVVVVNSSPANGALSPSCTPQNGQVLVIVLGGSGNQGTQGDQTNQVPTQGLNQLPPQQLPPVPNAQQLTPGSNPTQVPLGLNATQGTPGANATQGTPGATGGQQTLEPDMSNITDPRIDTYAKRQAIRDQYRGRMDILTFNDELSDGVPLDQALADAIAAFGHPTSSPSH